VGAHSGNRSLPFSPVSRRNPIKPVYDPDQPDGRLNLTASAFNQLGRYTSSPGPKGYCYQNSPFSSLAVAVTIASTHCAYPRRDGQAELAWVAGYVVRQFTCPKAVTHPNTNRAQCMGNCVDQDQRVTATLNRHLKLLANSLSMSFRTASEDFEADIITPAYIAYRDDRQLSRIFMY